MNWKDHTAEPPPDDGTPFLVKVEDDHFPVKCIRWVGPPYSAWEDEDCGRCDPRYWLGWMPIPI